MRSPSAFAIRRNEATRNILLATLHRADIVRMKLGFFRQDLLSESQPLPFFADIRAQDNPVIFGRCHSPTQNQTWHPLSKPLNG